MTKKRLVNTNTWVFLALALTTIFLGTTLLGGGITGLSVGSGSLGLPVEIELPPTIIDEDDNIIEEVVKKETPSEQEGEVPNKPEAPFFETPNESPYQTIEESASDVDEKIVITDYLDVETSIDILAAPVISNVILNSTSGTNLTTENLTVHWDATDNTTKNITNWKLNGTSITVLNMPFEKNVTGTNTKDYSGFNHDGTEAGGITWNANGGYDNNGAYEFDAEDDYLTIADTDDLDSSDGNSFEFWVKTNCTGRLLYNRGGQSAAVGYNWISLEANSLNYQYANGTDVVVASSGAITWTLNQWVHIVVVHDNLSKKINFYKDGQSAGTSAYTDIPLSVNSGTAYIGTYQGWGAGYAFNGTMDEIRIYNRSLSAEQVKALYENKTHIISSNETSINDDWSVCITPNDGIQDGTEVCSSNLTIVNIAPSAINVNITSSDTLNRTNGTLSGHYTFNDSAGDGEIDNQTKWFNNSEEVSDLQNLITVHSDNLTKHQNWTFSVRVYDGVDWGDWVNSTSDITIENAAPTFNESLTDQRTNVDDGINLDINCSDIDGDTITYYDNTSLFDINSTNGYVNDTPLESEIGSHEINITCGDGETNISQSFTYTIDPKGYYEVELVGTNYGGTVSSDASCSGGEYIQYSNAEEGWEFSTNMTSVGVLVTSSAYGSWFDVYINETFYGRFNTYTPTGETIYQREIRLFNFLEGEEYNITINHTGAKNPAGQNILDLDTFLVNDTEIIDEREVEDSGSNYSGTITAEAQSSNGYYIQLINETSYWEGYGSGKYILFYAHHSPSTSYFNVSYNGLNNSFDTYDTGYKYQQKHEWFINTTDKNYLLTINNSNSTNPQGYSQASIDYIVFYPFDRPANSTIVNETYINRTHMDLNWTNSSADSNRSITYHIYGVHYINGTSRYLANTSSNHTQINITDSESPHDYYYFYVDASDDYMEGRSNQTTNFYYLDNKSNNQRALDAIDYLLDNQNATGSIPDAYDSEFFNSDANMLYAGMAFYFAWKNTTNATYIEALGNSLEFLAGQQENDGTWYYAYKYNATNLSYYDDVWDYYKGENKTHIKVVDAIQSLFSYDLYLYSLSGDTSTNVTNLTTFAEKGMQRLITDSYDGLFFNSSWQYDNLSEAWESFGMKYSAGQIDVFLGLMALWNLTNNETYLGYARAIKQNYEDYYWDSTNSRFGIGITDDILDTTEYFFSQGYAPAVFGNYLTRSNDSYTYLKSLEQTDGSVNSSGTPDGETLISAMTILAADKLNKGNTTNLVNYVKRMQLDSSSNDGGGIEYDKDTATKYIQTIGFAVPALLGEELPIPNYIPYFNPNLTNQTISPESEFDYLINCTDLDGDNITYFDNSTLFEIDSTSGLISDIPSAEEIGAYTINITCSDGKINTSQTFIYTIDRTNPYFENYSNTSLNFRRYQNFIANATIYVNTEGQSLNSYIFSTNTTGSWVNSSARSISDDGYNASESANITLAKGNQICWYYWADSDLGENSSSLTQCFDVSNTPPITTEVDLISTSTNDLSSDNLTVSYSTSDIDGHSIVNQIEWYNDSVLIYNYSKEVVSPETDSQLYLSFDGSANNNDVSATDYSTFNNTVLAINATWNSTGDLYRLGAYEFNKIDSHLSIADDSSLDSGDYFAFSCWIKPEAIVGASTLYNRNTQTTNRGYHLIDFDSDSVNYQYANGTDSVSIASNPVTWSVGQWYQIAVVHDNISKKIYFYRDGDSIGETTYTDMAYQVDSGTAYIGTYQAVGNSDFSFNGTMDEARIYSHSLSAEEVKALYVNRTNTIISNETALGDNWSVCIIPHDGFDDGITSCTGNTTISEEEEPETPPGPGGGGGGGAAQKTCVTDADCSTGYYCNEDNFCKKAQCFVNSDCDKDKYCVDHKCVKLFDLEVLYADSPIQPGEYLDFTYLVKGMADISGDVFLDYWLEDTKTGEKVTSGSKVIYVGDFEELIKEGNLYLPSNLKIGNYVFYLKLKYEDYIITVHQTVEIKQEVIPALTLNLLDWSEITPLQPANYSILIASNKDEVIVVNLQQNLTKLDKLIRFKQSDIPVNRSTIVTENIPGLEEGTYTLDIFASYENRFFILKETFVVGSPSSISIENIKDVFNKLSVNPLHYYLIGAVLGLTVLFVISLIKRVRKNK